MCWIARISATVALSKQSLPVVRCGFTSSSTKEATTCLDNDSNDSAPAADEEVDTRSPSLEVEIPVPWQSIELSAVATRLLVTLRCLTFVDLGVVELLMVAVASVTHPCSSVNILTSSKLLDTHQTSQVIISESSLLLDSAQAKWSLEQLFRLVAAARPFDNFSVCGHSQIRVLDGHADFRHGDENHLCAIMQFLSLQTSMRVPTSPFPSSLRPRRRPKNDRVGGCRSHI